MERNKPEYVHIQKGILQPILFGCAMVCLTIAWFTRDSTPQTVIFAVSALFCGLLSAAFAYLSVRDEGVRLSIRFGPVPIFRKSIFYKDITAVQKDRSHFLSGWGIHLTRKGWLWNIGGFDCVYIEIGEKKTLVGTDDPDGLTAFLLSRVSGLGAPERKSS